jgi:hypothetical protein
MLVKLGKEKTYASIFKESRRLAGIQSTVSNSLKYRRCEEGTHRSSAACVVMYDPLSLGSL